MAKQQGQQDGKHAELHHQALTLIDALQDAGMELDRLRLSPDLVIPAAELSWRFSRSSGPGGQNVNKIDSRVQLSFDLARSEAMPRHLKARAMQRLAVDLLDGVVVITASEYRSQLRNRVAAIGRLVELLRAAIAPPPPPRRATRPSRAAVERRLRAKKQRSLIKDQRSALI